MPAFANLSSMGKESVAGPIVQIIFVLRMRVSDRQVPTIILVSSAISKKILGLPSEQGHLISIHFFILILECDAKP